MACEEVRALKHPPTHPELESPVRLAMMQRTVSGRPRRYAWGRAHLSNGISPSLNCAKTTNLIRCHSLVQQNHEKHAFFRVYGA